MEPRLITSILLIFIFIEFSTSDQKIFTIEGGKIVGETLDDFYAIRGIPYAESPVGDLRLAPPKKYSEKWDDVREYKKYGDVCAQYDHFEYAFDGSEDCLSLNVFVPKAVTESSVKAPVLFYIHGGAFMFGGAKYFGPELIMKAQNMILVTVNYRVGVLGFLSTEDEKISGNFGLKDQVEALKWVQRNIEAFNGDPKKVTLVGFSAGGASTQLHYMSPLSDGLFNNGISHSGVAIDPWVMMENAKKKAHGLAKEMNCPHNDHGKLLECLRTKPAKDLVLFAKTLQPFMYNPFSPFGVVVEKSHPGAFIDKHPLTHLKKGTLKKLPWLVSQTQDEGLYPAAEFYNEKTLKEINDRWDEIAPAILDFDGVTDNKSRKSQIAKRIRKFYLGNSQINKENFVEFDNILSDRLFKHGAHIAIQLYGRFAPSFFYYFKYKSLDGVVEMMAKTNEDIGIAHGEDVMLIFFNNFRHIPYIEEELQMSRKLVAMYYSFATTNQPVFDKMKIEKCKIDDIKYLEISSPTEYKMLPVDEEFGSITFWDEIEEILLSRDRTFYDEL